MPLPPLIIRTRSLCKRYAMGDTVVHALREVSVDIAAGEMVAVMGPSGSGKSTFARKMASEIGACVFETDEFFIVDGEYRFDPSKLGWAHKSNQRRTLKALEEGKTVIESLFLESWNGYWASPEDMGYPLVAIGSSLFSYMSGQIVYFDYGMSSVWEFEALG